MEQRENRQGETRQPHGQGKQRGLLLDGAEAVEGLVNHVDEDGDEQPGEESPFRFGCLAGFFRTGVLVTFDGLSFPFRRGTPALPVCLPQRVEQRAGDHEPDDDHAGPRHPAHAVDLGGKEQVVVGDAPQHEPQQQGGALPVVAHHQPPQGAEQQHHDHVAEAVLDREAAQEDEQQQERDQVGALDESDPGQLLEKEEADGDGDDVGEHDDPDEGEGQVQVLVGVQQVRSGDDALDDERSQQDRHAHAAGHSESDGGDQRPSLLGVVGGAGPQHSFHRSLTEGGLVFGAALDRVGVGHPLGGAAAQTRYQPDVGADGAAAEHQLPLPEGVPDPLHHSAQRAGRVPGDAAPLGPQLDDLRDGEEPHGDGHQRESVPQEQDVLASEDGLQGVARHAGDGVEPHHGQHQAEAAGGKALGEVAAAQGRQEGDAQQAEHHELRRADGQHQRLHDGDGQGQREGAEDGAYERAHERGSQRTPGLPALGHGMAVDDGGRGDAFARHPEQHRGDVAGGGGDRVAPQQERERGGGVHLVDERQHQRQRGGAAEPRQYPHGKADGDADHHEQEGVLPGRGEGQHRREAGEQGAEVVKHGSEALVSPRGEINSR